MRIVSEGGRTWGVIEHPLRDPPFHKTYVDLPLIPLNTVEDGTGGILDGVFVVRPQGRMLGEEQHGRTCTCFPCEQANERMDRDDPSVGGYDPTK